MTILGISAFYHDSAAALVRDGQIIAAAQEERFSRVKHDARFPQHAIAYCLAAAGMRAGGALDAIAFYDKPLQKFSRLLQSYVCTAPHGLRSFMMALPLWLKEKLWLPVEIDRGLRACGVPAPPAVLYPEHHESHAASAFLPSPFQRAAILTIDGVGEWATSTIAHGQDHTLTLLKELHFPHSLGLLYSAFTYFTGFKVNSGEYKLMGLAPYGAPRYVQAIYDHLIDLHDDGSFHVNLDYFDYVGGLTMTNGRFARLFGGPPRAPESAITAREADLARSIQAVTEEIVLRMARHARALTGEDCLCLAGGVALNCVANGRLLRAGLFKDIWIQPAAGDAGGALGAALFAWHQLHDQPRRADGAQDAMHGAYLGPEYADDDIAAFLAAHGYPARKLADQEWAPELARLLDEQQVIGIVNGRMEFGPRALGNRSIVGDARSPQMQSIMNLKIKYRESFRPFAPSCLVERVQDYFELDRPSPYMLLVAGVQPALRQAADAHGASLREQVNAVRSAIPAVTHVDYTARVQTVDAATNPRYHALLKAFEARTGCGVIINTSFNVRGEPIVCTPADAYRCFMRTEMDYLVLGSYLLDKRAQPSWHETHAWQRDYVLD
jgi:carbamoyltransferase